MNEMVDSVAVSFDFQHGSRLIFSGWPFTGFFSEHYWRAWTELNRTEASVKSATHRGPRSCTPHVYASICIALYFLSDRLLMRMRLHYFVQLW